MLFGKVGFRGFAVYIIEAGNYAGITHHVSIVERQVEDSLY